MDKKTGKQITDEFTHIRQSIQDILITPVGSRIQRRDYGSFIFELIDRPLSAELRLQLAVASVLALKKWEPRIEITRFAVEFLPQQASVLADIECVRKGDLSRLTLNDITLGMHHERIS